MALTWASMSLAVTAAIFVNNGVVGATISGGGASGFTNQVTASFGTIGGGIANTASGFGSTVGGGEVNLAPEPAATIPGGIQNTAAATTPSPPAASQSHPRRRVRLGGFARSTTLARRRTTVPHPRGGRRRCHGKPDHPGSLRVDSTGVNNGAVFGVPALPSAIAFPAKGIASKRTAGGNQYALDFIPVTTIG